MKELSIEQKAKAYDKALEAIKSLQEVNPSDEGIQNWINENFPELKESEDEKIGKKLMCFLETEIAQCAARDKYIAWLKKQGEHNKFRDSIQIGDKVTRNEDGVLVNLSQLKRVAKKDEKQGEQKPAEWHREDEQNLNACLGYIPDEFLRKWLQDAIHVKYDKHAWSEEDEKMFELALNMIEWYSVVDKDKLRYVSDWLKSLKGRVQPKQEWCDKYGCD